MYKFAKGVKDDQRRGNGEQPDGCYGTDKSNASGAAPNDEQADVVPPVRILVVPENHNKHHGTSEKSIKSDAPHRKFGSEHFHQRIEQSEQQRCRQHE